MPCRKEMEILTHLKERGLNLKNGKGINNNSTETGIWSVVLKSFPTACFIWFVGVITMIRLYPMSERVLSS